MGVYDRERPDIIQDGHWLNTPFEFSIEHLSPKVVSPVDPVQIAREHPLTF